MLVKLIAPGKNTLITRTIMLSLAGMKIKVCVACNIGRWRFRHSASVTWCSPWKTTTYLPCWTFALEGLETLCNTFRNVFISVYTVFYNSNSCFLYLTLGFWTEFLMYITSSGEEKPFSHFQQHWWQGCSIIFYGSEYKIKNVWNRWLSATVF